MKTFPKPLSHGEEKLYLKRCKEGDQTARNMLIEHNMRLVAHVVKKYQCQEYDTEDLLSVGTIGLIKAVNTFDTDKGSRLATYAARCVENEILMLLRAGKKRAREVSLFEPIGTEGKGAYPAGSCRSFRHFTFLCKQDREKGYWENAGCI